MAVSASASGCLLSARPGALSFERDAATGHQQCPGADKQRDKAQVDGGTGIPLNGIAGSSGRHGHVRAERDVAGVEVLLGVKMDELYDEGRTLGIDGKVDWTRLEAKSGKMIESGLELADRIGAA